MKANWQILTTGTLVALALTAFPARSQTGQPTFAAPEEAIHAVADAAEHNDTAALLKLFGPGGKELVEPAGDAA